MREVIRNAEEQANPVAGATRRQRQGTEGRQAVQHGQQAHKPVERQAQGRRQQGQGRKLDGAAAAILLLSVPGWAGVIMTIVMAITLSPWFLVATAFFAVIGRIQAGHYRKHRAARHRAR